MNKPIPIDGHVEVTDWGVMRAVGPDAASFLQGQLTNDVAGLSTSQARLAGFCSAKGRLQASFVVWRTGPDTFFLACPTSLLAATLKRLSMFVMRAKCRLGDASADVRLVGVAGASALAAMSEFPVWATGHRGGSTVVRLPDAAGVVRALVAVDAVLPREHDAPSAAALAFDEQVGSGPAITLQQWRWLDVQSGIVTIEAATVDRFVPQMINFELVGGIDFGKGCYPGQEVVARSQYRGTVKRRTFLFECDAVPTAGQDVFHSSDPSQPSGTVANAAAGIDNAGGIALVEVRLAMLDGGSFHLGVADGPTLRRLPLPYPLEVDVDTGSDVSR